MSLIRRWGGYSIAMTTQMSAKIETIRISTYPVPPNHYIFASGCRYWLRMDKQNLQLSYMIIRHFWVRIGLYVKSDV